MRRLITLFLFSAIVAVSGNFVTATPAYACSCAGDPFAFFEESDVELAFVGTVADRTPLIGLNKILWTFDTEEVLVGEAGPSVRVRAPSTSASCGLSAAPGDSMAVVAFKEGRVWATVSCDVGSPEQAVGFGDPTPPDESIGPGVRFNNGELARYGLAVSAGLGLLGLGAFGVRRLRTGPTSN